LAELRRARPSESLWSQIEERAGLAPPTAARRLALFVSGRLGRSTESLMRAVAVGAVAVAMTTLSAASFGVLLSGADGSPAFESPRGKHATGLSPSEVRIQPAVAGHAWDRRLPPGSAGAVWRLRLRGAGDVRPFDPPCDIFHLRPVVQPLGEQAPTGEGGCRDAAGEGRPLLPGLPLHEPVPDEVRL
jgi:hypothetical protein